ncbi:MAG: AAA family ATPase [Candidatus Pelethousia sp.]|nr:AAA family ATPase [Candidatus Pelethousia sp.]
MEHLKKEQLSRIRIQGFKSIKDCDLRLRKINVLIGSNGAGKSNFISAFTLLQNVLTQNLGLYAAQAGLNALFFKGRKITENIGIEIFFGEINHGEASYGFTLNPTDDNQIVFGREYFGYHGLMRNQSVIARGHSESKWMQGTTSIASDYIVATLKEQSWRVYHFHDTSRSAKIKQEHNLSNNKVLLFDASNLAAFLYRLKQHYKEDYRLIVETIRLIAPYFDDFDLIPNEGNKELIVLRWKQKSCEDIFNASQLSDGTLRFICLATLLLQPAELRPATIIIDEPELGLHPYAITVFSELVHSASVDSQIILSTQSVELLNEFDAEDVIIADRDEDHSTFKRLNAKELKDWLDNDYSLGELWNKNILGGRLSK